MSLKRTINEHVLKESDIDDRPAQDLCSISTDRDSKSDEGGTPQESKGENLSLESSFPGSPPKCFTPRRQSPPKFEISLDNLTQLLQVPVTTPRKNFRQKVEAVMGSVESVCLEKGETFCCTKLPVSA